MWERGYLPRVRSGELPWRAAEESLAGLAPGSQLRILSRDPQDGALTALWRLPPGWEQPQGFALTADAELFVLEGRLQEGAQSVPRGGYVHRAAGAAHPPLTTHGGALVYAMWSAAPRLEPLGSAASPASPGDPASDAGWTDTGAMAEQPTPVAGPVPGIQVRILRRDAASGGMTLIVAIPPGWEEPRSEHHDCVEESFKLAGDIWLHENHRPQVLEAGDYFFRPPRIKHGPMRTRGGTTSLIRFSATVVNHYGPIED